MRSALRPALSDAVVASVIRRLSGRDRLLCHYLYEHQVLTSSQVGDLLFSTQGRARLRLIELYRLRVLDRFRPQTEVGSAPYHYVLDDLGAKVLAGERGVEVGDLRFRPPDLLAWAASPRLAHLVGTNAVFCALTAAARRLPDADLVEWWSERRCAQAMGGLVRPDGYGFWREGDRTVEFCLEYDRGTEPLARLADKLAGYRDLAEATGVARWTLFWLPGPRREAEARRALAGAPVPVATANAAAGSAPGAVWLPLDATRRVALGRLGPCDAAMTRKPTTVDRRAQGLRQK